MSLRDARTAATGHPVVRELVTVTAVLTLVYFWERLLPFLSGPLAAALDGASGSAHVGILLASSLFLVGTLAIVRGYAAVRSLDAGLSLPTRDDADTAALAVGLPLLAVALTKAVGLFTGVTFGELARRSYASDPPLFPVLFVVGVSTVVGVVTLVVLCQVVIQGSLARALDGQRTVVLTALVTGFVATSNVSGFAIVPDTGRLVGAVLFVGLLLVGLLVSDAAAWDGRRVAAALGVCFLVVVVASTALETDSVAGGLYTLTHLATLAVAAYAYERSGSLLLPALSYLTVVLGGHAVVLVAEVGLFGS